ncbi:MAG: hypothetical protein M9952_03340 [Microthrixaceae bacterium]|nr:hypothetical protein [Microthrixaceae bacterium]MCO5311953.1 hypothetical protein [Microthrixaceae bacterium]
MRHAQFHIADIQLGTRSLPLRYGTLQVVDREGTIDWELVLHTIDPEPVAQAIHLLAFRSITGVEESGALTLTPMQGEAALVRWVDNSLVFRGAGLLDGFDESQFG